MYRICVICVYMGKFPIYSNLWLDSCQRNYTIVFLLITDQTIQNCPPNVILKNMTLQELRERIQIGMKEKIVLDKPYKSCDFRPMFGYIFQKELIGYDFWGHCDMDVIFGNIRKFVTDELLDKYDKIYPLGHFSLYRNSDKCNLYFKLEGSLVGNYKYVISTSKSCVFDEVYGIDKIFEYNKLPLYEKRDCADINYFVKRMKLVGPSFKNYMSQAFFMKNGECYRVFESCGTLHYEEFCYIHLQKRAYTGTINNHDCYYVAPDSFIPFAGTVEVCDIREINPYRGKVNELIEEFINEYAFRIKRKFKSFFIK